MYQKRIIETLNGIFPGFYESIISGTDFLEIRESDDNHELDGYIEKNGYELQYDYKDYEKWMLDGIDDLYIEKINETAKEYLNIDKLIMKKESSEMDSPKFYNYGTDRGFLKVHIDGTKYTKFINMMFKKHGDTLSQHIKDNFTSYDGFSSFYSNNIDDWWDKRYNYDHNELSTLFDALLDLEGEDLTYDLSDIARDVFGETDMWYTKTGDKKKYGFYDLVKMAGIEV